MIWAVNNYSCSGKIIMKYFNQQVKAREVADLIMSPIRRENWAPAASFLPGRWGLFSALSIVSERTKEFNSITLNLQRAAPLSTEAQRAASSQSTTRRVQDYAPSTSAKGSTRSKLFWLWSPALVWFTDVMTDVVDGQSSFYLSTKLKNLHTWPSAWVCFRP